MLEEMRRKARDAGLVVKNLFSEFDDHASGYVSGEQFLCVIGTHGLLGAGKVLDAERYGHVLVKAFTQRAAGPGLEAVLVNYRALHDQIMSVDCWDNEVVEAEPAFLIDSCPEEYSVLAGYESERERLERLLVQEAVARRIEVMDYFYAEGGGHVTGSKHPGSVRFGVCSRERFRHLLKGLWRTHLTSEQVATLADRFLLPVDRSSTRRACNHVDLVAFAKYISTRVSAARERVAAAEKSCNRPGGGGVAVPPRLSAAEAKLVENVVLDIKARIKRERISLKPAFKNFDPRNELVVTNDQFARVLSARGLLPIDTRLQELLTRRYAVSDFRRQKTILQGFVTYLEFLRDVDAPLEMGAQTHVDNFVNGRDQSLDAREKNDDSSSTTKLSPSNKTAFQRETAETSSTILRSAASLTSEALMGRKGVGCEPVRDCDAVIRDIRRRTVRERVRIMDLFQDFDRLQHGTCTQAQLARVMKTLDHTLTDDELAAVCKSYQKRAPNEHSSGDGTPLINYKMLVTDIEAIFTVGALERKPATTVVGEEVRKARGIERLLRGESSRVEQLNQEEERMLAKFLRELAMKVNKDSLDLSSLFTDYDRFNTGDITEAAMERALGASCLLPQESVFRTLVKKFRGHSRRSSGDEINYKAFLAAVELAQDPLNTPRDVPNATKFRALRADGADDNSMPYLCPAPPDDDAMMTPRRRSAALRSALLSLGKQLSLTHCHLEDFLAQEDDLNTGHVTCPAMRHCLVLAGVCLTSPELMALERAFRSPTRPETITWQDLCRTAIRLNTGILGGASTMATSDHLVTNSSSDLEEEEILLKIEGEIKARNPNLEDLFKTFDRSNRGTVSEEHFFSVLKQGAPKVHFTSKDTETLARLFVDRTGYDFGGQVRYKTFLKAVGC
ncbi:unnamed protein product [Ascophyllum nodosum]